MRNTSFSSMLTRGGWRPSDIMRDLQRASQLIVSRHVPMSLKLILPLGAAIYWFFPLDLIPGLPFDDIAVVLLAVKLFVSMGDAALSRDTTPDVAGKGDEPIVDTTWHVMDE
mgnify:CR=1 FL=1